MALGVALACLACLGQLQQLHEDFDSGFRPRVTAVSFDAREVRPTGRVGLLFEFKNEGTTAAEREYRVFLHIEPKQSCSQILVHRDHIPSVPTRAWEPGQSYLDGPIDVQIGALTEGKYWIHVGLFDPESGARKLELYWPEQIVVKRDAAEAVLTPLADDKLRARRTVWDRRIGTRLSVKTQHLELQVSRQTGAWRVVDMDTGATWDGGLLQGGAGWADFQRGDEQKRAWLTQVASTELVGQGVKLVYTPPGLPQVRCLFSLREDGRSVDFRLEADDADGWKLVASSMVDNCLPVTDVEGGHLFAPVYNGWDYPASSGMMWSHGCPSFRHEATFQMLGLQRNGSAAMLSWDDCYGSYRASSLVEPPAPIPGAQAILTSLWTDRPPTTWRFTVVGEGSYPEICRAYREVARERGFLKTWQEKWAKSPGMRALAGAADMKPFVLSRTVAGTKYNKTDQDRVHVGYTFAQAAEMAEHWKRDLELDRILFVLAGWIHRGYDNQHPDILPAAPECGGNDGLADCSRRVRELGYLFGLHDNYQDLYPDAPSFDLKYTIKNRADEPVLGGEWAGGRCYLICSKVGLDLARRNLPEVKRLFKPTIYFTDTTYAAGLYECYDPQHPTTRDDDRRYKSALAEYCREVFGGHGSEHGWEWGVPVSDYFEGNSYASHHSDVGARDGHAVPMLELIYHDCVAIYAHQGWRTGPSDATAVLRYLAVGRMPLYQFTGPRYWEKQGSMASLPVQPLAPKVTAIGPRRFRIAYRWRAIETPEGDPRCFVHFTTRDGVISFQDDHVFSPPLKQWRTGEVTEEAARVVEVPAEVGQGFYEIRLGAFDENTGRYGLWSGNSDGEGRYVVGYVQIGPDGGITYTPAKEKPVGDPGVFARSDNPKVTKLCPTDRFIKNTYEFLSAVNRLCFDVPMVDHKYLQADGSVEKSRFANGCEIVVNVGLESYAYENANLPPNGFLVRAPTLAAFYATRMGVVEYESKGALFVAVSLDGKPLEESERIRVYRGFGEAQFPLATRRAAVMCGGKKVETRDGLALVEVQGEEIVTAAE